MSNDALSKIKARIQALLAKANGTDNEHEAEAFLAKANELLQQYQLDIADLADAGDPILHHTGLSRAESGHAWRWKLYSVVAQLYGCKTIHVDVGLRTKDGRNWNSYADGKPTAWYEQRVIGRESAVITVDLMYPWIVGQVRKAAREIAAVTGMSEQGQAKRVAAALISRICKLIRDQQETPPPRTAAARNALVVTSNAVALRYKELYPKTVAVRAGKATTDDLSKAAANGIGLHRQATGGAVKALGRG